MDSKRGVLHLYGIIAFDAIVLDSENCQFSTQRGQCTERLLNSRTCNCMGMTLGGLSVFVCCVGMAVPLNRTGCKSPPLFLFGGGNNKVNIATQPNKLFNYEKNAFL